MEEQDGQEQRKIEGQGATGKYVDSGATRSLEGSDIVYKETGSQAREDITMECTETRSQRWLRFWTGVITSHTWLRRFRRRS